VIPEQLLAKLKVSIGQDDGTVEEEDIDCYFEPSGDGYGGKWFIGQPGYDEWEWETQGGESGDGGSVKLNGMLDPDPQIAFALTAVDFGAPSNFSFNFVLPLSPQVTNPSMVSDSLSGSVTNGPAAGGVTVTALAPPAGIPVDGDGVTELQVYTLSDDDASTWKNVGLDAGPTTVISPLAGLGSGLYPAFNQGPTNTIAGGPWTHMRADLNFRLTGGGDTFTLNGAKVITPEPSTCALAMFALGMLGYSRRPTRRV
jgi:hypothetical protein